MECGSLCAFQNAILLVPLILDEQVLGVTELASFKTFEKYQVDFVMRIAENMGSTFSGTRVSLRTQKLLKESQIQEEQLRAQEEEMRQNMEELTTLAAGKSNVDVFRRKDAAGKIIWLNAIYNPILGLKGEVIRVIKFASDITPQKESEIEVKNLLEESTAQEEELRQTKEEISATQEDMKRQSDNLLKSSSEMSSVLNGINATMATIEFSPEGVVIKANENFMKAMSYSLNELKGKHHRLFMPVDLLQSEDVAGSLIDINHTMDFQ